MLSPALLRAQTGVIEGEVAAAGTGEPLTGAGVFVQELDIGRLSQPSGRFPVENMPPGSDALTAQRAGHVTKDTGAAVSAGQAVAVNLQMDDRAVALDEIVVTGLAGGARRRTLGNAWTAPDSGKACLRRRWTRSCGGACGGG